MKVQSILSRTFSAEDIIEIYKDINGGYGPSAQCKLKNRINLSKGNLIITNDLSPSKEKVVIADISTIPPISTATLILETMSRRYL